MEVADTVAVMNLGRIEQVGPPREIYDHPATAFVARFVGQMNQLQMEAEGLAFARPHEMEVSRDPDCGEPARVAKLLPIGLLVRLRLRLPAGDDLEVQLTRERVQELGIVEGDQVHVRPSRVRVFQEGGQA